MYEVFEDREGPLSRGRLAEDGSGLTRGPAGLDRHPGWSWEGAGQRGVVDWRKSFKEFDLGTGWPILFQESAAGRNSS